MSLQNFTVNLTGDFLLIIIIVTGGEELSEDESRHIDFLHLVLHHGNTLPIIPHTDGVVFAKRKNIDAHFIMCFCATEESSWAGYELWLVLFEKLQAKGHCGRIIRHSEILIGRAILYITHTSMLTLMQDMLLSLCLLSAAFTVGRIKTQIVSVHYHGMVNIFVYLHYRPYKTMTAIYSPRISSKIL